MPVVSGAVYVFLTSNFNRPILAGLFRLRITGGKTLKILVVGDIVGRPGRKALKTFLPSVQKEYGIDFTIANAENAAGGRGLTREITAEILNLNIDVLTMGNHVWDNKDIYNFIDDEPRLIRPVNYPGPCPGQGYHLFTGGVNRKIAVINAMGRTFLPPLDCPFQAVEEVLREISAQADIIIIDLHAEATSEKLGFGYYFDGRVTAVVGTHTHIQTADERILPRGTAYITDLGMTGPSDSILGMDKELVIKKLTTMRPVRLEVASGPVQFQAIVMDVDDSTNRVTKIMRISRV